MPHKPKLAITTISMSSGGTERVISTLLPELIKDFEVFLLIYYNSVHYYIPQEVKLKVILPNKKQSKNIFEKLKDSITITKQYIEFIKQNKIIYSLSLLPLPNIVNSILATKKLGVKTIISERCYASLTYQRSSLYFAKLAFPYFYNKNHVLFSNSEHINTDLKNNFGVNIPMKVIYNPVNIVEENRVSKQINQNQTFKIINVGSLVWRKNQKLIIEAIKQIKTKKLHVNILGAGNLEAELKNLTTQYQLKNKISFLGNVNNVPKYLFEADCFVLSSQTEGFPNVLIEALSCGLPVISTNCMSGPLELLNDNIPVSIKKGDFYFAKYGILVNTDDIEGLAKAILYVINHPEIREKYHKTGLERAQDFNITHIYAQIKDLILN